MDFDAIFVDFEQNRIKINSIHNILCDLVQNLQQSHQNPKKSTRITIKIDLRLIFMVIRVDFYGF